MQKKKERNRRIHGFLMIGKRYWYFTFLASGPTFSIGVKK
jgi:hypothetical protein